MPHEAKSKKIEPHTAQSPYLSFCLICKPADISVPQGWTHKSLKESAPRPRALTDWLVSWHSLLWPTSCPDTHWWYCGEPCQAGPSTSFPLTRGWWSILTSSAQDSHMAGCTDQVGWPLAFFGLLCVTKRTRTHLGWFKMLIVVCVLLSASQLKQSS